MRIFLSKHHSTSIRVDQRSLVWRRLTHHHLYKFIHSLTCLLQLNNPQFSTSISSMDFTIPISSPPTLPIFFTMFLTIYLIAHFIVFRNWSPKLRPEAASCLISLAHGSPAVVLAGAAIVSDPTHGFASINTQFQNSVLEYSIAYFLMDLCHYLTFYPNDILFISHHLATLFVFITCRYLAFHGAYAVLILLVLAEITSFLQNLWTLANARRGDSEVAAQVFDLLSLPFYALYSVVRGFAAPLFVYKMIAFYSTGAADHVLPKWLWVSWMCVVVMAISVSVLWISNNWIMLFRERMIKIEKEKKDR